MSARIEADVGHENIESTSGTSARMPTSTATDLSLVSRDATSPYDHVTSTATLDDDAASAMKVYYVITSLL